MIDIDRYLSDLEKIRQNKLTESLLDHSKKQMELFEQYVLAKDDHPDLRKRLNINEAGLPLAGQDGLRRQLAAIDLEYFARAYLPHYFTRSSPEFHKELDALWNTGVLKGINPLTDKDALVKLMGSRRAVAAPRGHAKSTNFTFKDSLHAILYAYKHYIIILSDSSDQAEGFLSDIMEELETNEAIIEDFGKLVGPVWRASVFLTSSGVKVEAIGSGKKIRGRRHRNWRPDLIILDDVENDENVNTVEQRQKLYNWFVKAVSKAGDTYTDIVYIGTMLHYDGLLAKVLKNPQYRSATYKGVISFAKNEDLWETWSTLYCDLMNDDREADARRFYESNEQEMLDGVQVLWPEKWTYYDLMVMKVSEGDASFGSEIQNEPIDPKSRTFNEEWFDFYEDGQVDFTDPRFIFFAANDPSLGKNLKADTSSIITLAKDMKSGYMYVFEASVERRKPDTIIDDVIELSKRVRRDVGKRFTKIGVESIQFQAYFANVMAIKSAESGEYLPITEINSVGNKKVRIESLQPFVKNKYIKFNRKHKALLEQMYNYPMTKNDDGPDGLEMVVKLAIAHKLSLADGVKILLKRRSRFAEGAF